jgi:oligoribonuclease NrnB/cAMP/cGMP phosphodiesterase (DHH superfamily)
MSVTVIYHENCFDGTGAKLAAWLKFGQGATYTPAQYGDPVPHIPKGSEVYILDFSYPREALEALQKDSKSLLVLDHHKTAKEALAGLPYAQFDMDKSGAVLAWEHFHPGKQIPDLLLRVQDRDLWKWKYEDTKSVTSALPLLENSMEAWNAALDGGPYLEQLRVSGQVKERFDKLSVAAAIKTVHPLVITTPHRFYTVGLVNSTSLGSEIGNALCEEKGFDIGMPYFVSDKGQVVLSLRSVGDLDTTVISSELGGGGHKNASGAKVRAGVLALLYGASYHQPVSLETLKQYV